MIMLKEAISYQFTSVLWYILAHDLHVNNYMHWDVRIKNMLFNEELWTGCLIDFDLARKEGDPYELDARHPDALPSQPMFNKVHDRTSLYIYTVKWKHTTLVKLKDLNHCGTILLKYELWYAWIRKKFVTVVQYLLNGEYC